MGGVAQARHDGQPLGLVPRQLVTRGYTDHVRFLGWRDRGLLLFLTAHGTVQDQPDWRFLFEEHVLISLPCLRVTNRGLMTVETPLGDLAVRFAGRVCKLRRLAEGECTAEGLGGCFAGWRSTGTYVGSAWLRFQVTYTLWWPPELLEQCRLV